VSGSTVRVARCIDTRVVVASGAHLEVLDLCGGLDVTGPGRVMLSTADIVIFRQPAVTLDLGLHAQVSGSTGSVRLGRVARATVSGDGAAPGVGQGLMIESVDPTSDALDGVSLLNARFPVSLAGRQSISALRLHADSVTPRLTDDIPGRGVWRRPSRAPHPPRDELQMQAEFTRALADLAAERGAPASIRTDLAWSAYRMRNASAPGKTERCILSAYRVIGYGERALPPLALYCILALLMALCALHDHPWDPNLNGIKTLGDAYLTWLVTPLHLLHLTEDPKNTFSLPGHADTFARIAIAIPFVTAVLALRNYVKEDHRKSR
jgi:hypothetical protein